MTAAVEDASIRHKMPISVNKTKAMIIGRENEALRIHLNAGTVTQVDWFKYLGVTFTRDMDSKLRAELQLVMRPSKSCGRSGGIEIYQLD